jgi:hypothetical protein
VQAGGNIFEQTNLILAQTMDDGPAPVTYINMNVNNGLGNIFPNSGGAGEWQYLFDLSSNNAASSVYAPGYIPPNYTVSNRALQYGLGGQSWQRYSKFEGGAFPLVTTDFTFDPVSLQMDGTNASVTGLYHLMTESLNTFEIGDMETLGSASTNDYVLARAAIVPQDVVIEATMFAEEGSFFVIPGPWFNPNPNDTRQNYANLGASQNERDLNRLESYGSTPNMPFYGEPLDVKVSIIGSVSENMPPPIGQQAEWLKKWGWIPRYHGATGELIPQQHTSGIDVTPSGANKMYVPNITITYDPVLASDRNVGFVNSAGAGVDLSTMVRYQGFDLTGDNVPDIYYPLPPLPRLPVSPTLAYFGEVNP